MRTFDVSLLPFFDGQADGLRLSARGFERDPDEESEILRFIRTPEGSGVGVIRSNSRGEIWRVTESGSKLIRSGKWSSADYVVVLSGG